MMRAWLLAGVVASGWAGHARADVISTFAASGLFADGAALGGTVTIDVTTGVVTGAALSLGAPGTGSFTTIRSQGADPGASGSYQFIVSTSASIAIPQLALGTVTLSLLGFTGGDLTSVATPSSNNYTSIYFPNPVSPIRLASGQLTLVPEPASLALLGTAAAGLAALRRRRPA